MATPPALTLRQSMELAGESNFLDDLQPTSIVETTTRSTSTAATVEEPGNSLR